MASAAGPLLTIENLTKRFGGVTAVDGFHLTVGRGEILAVVGPNGAGKSTLFQLITGVERPDGGSIRLQEVELAGLPPEAIASLGVRRTFQTPRVFPALSILDSTRVGLHPALIGSGRPGRRVHPLVEIAWALLRPAAFRRREEAVDRAAQAALRRFGDRLWPRRADRADNLSYANRRRLEMARALAPEPLLLLLDEPTAGMNPTETREFADVLQALHGQRPALSIVLVEHKLPFVRRVADRVVIMNQGRKLVEGSPAGVMEDPRVIEAYLGTRAAGVAAGRRG